LLLASELVERLERLEGDVGLGALNLIFATMIATIVVCAAALMGDSILAAAERRMGRRPGARLVTPLLAVCGGAAAIGILVPHLNHPLALDGGVGLAGSLLLVIAAVAHHHLPDAPGPSER
jgi:peptidoglycan/LPS O-acetylase OafA/YrhL